MLKTCTGPCGLEKEPNYFPKKENSCKECVSKRQKEWYAKNREKILAEDKEYRKEHKGKRNEYSKKYREEHKLEIAEYNRSNKGKKREYDKNYQQENKERILKYKKEYRIKNREKISAAGRIYYIDNKKEISEKLKEYNKENPEINKKAKKKYRKIKYKNDPIYRLKNNISKLIGEYLKRNGSSKQGNSILEYLGRDYPQEVYNHIKNQFEWWMNQENYGRYDPKNWNDLDPKTWKWQIDHIIPQSDLPYTSMEDDNFKKCWDLKNLRPYSAKQNWSDGVNKTRHIKKK